MFTALAVRRLPLAALSRKSTLIFATCAILSSLESKNSSIPPAASNVSARNSAEHTASRKRHLRLRQKNSIILGMFGWIRGLPCILISVFILSGCCAGNGKSAPPLVVVPTTLGSAPAVYNSDVFAICAPPAGWKPDPLKSSPNHTQQVWLSPSGATAYGVIHFKMPLPVGQNMALQGFLDNMKSEQGRATLIERQDDPNLPGIRFVADDKRYRIRTNLIVRGWEGWAIYAGTFVNQPVNAAELQLAERAREQTKVGHVN
jgi:hypothetical protein